MNLADLVESEEVMQSVIMFDTLEELRDYTIATGKFMRVTC